MTHLWVVTTANGKFRTAFSMAEPEAHDGFCARSHIARAWIDRWQRHDPESPRDEWRWVKIGSNSWDLRCPAGITRYQAFRHQPKELSWRDMP